MQKELGLVSLGDLLIISLYGGAICYVHHYVFPIPGLYQLGASALLGFMLGYFGPDLGELIEWTLFFYIGILAIYLIPVAETLETTGNIGIEQILFSAKNAGIYFLYLIKVWWVGLPLGYLLHQLTDEGYVRIKPYYRSNRFY